MDTNLGDKILREYMKQTSKEDILQKLEIDDTVYYTWLKINKTELERIDDYLQKKKLKSKLKIRNIPELNDSDIESDGEDSDTSNKFLYKEPSPAEYQVHQQKKIVTLQHRRNIIQDKMNRLNDLETSKKIGHNEYLQAIKILNDEMDNVNKLLNESQSKGE